MKLPLTVVAVFLVLMMIQCDFPSASKDAVTRNYSLNVTDITGQNQTEIRRNDFATAQTYFSKDDSSLLILSPGSLSKLSLRDTTLLSHIPIPLEHMREYAIAPDHSSIVFVAGPDKWKGDIYRINANGTDLRRLTFTPETIERDIAFSSDGKKIVFCTLSVQGMEVQTVTIYDFELNTTREVIHWQKELQSVNPTFLFHSPVFIDQNSQIMYLKRNTEHPTLASLLLHNLQDNSQTLVDAKAKVFNPIRTVGNRGQFLYTQFHFPLGDLLLRNIQSSDSLVVIGGVDHDTDYIGTDDGATVLIWNIDNSNKYIYRKDMNLPGTTKLATGTQPSFSSD